MTMLPPHLLGHFFGGAFLANAIPHLVSGLLGRPFQTPFAKPRGEGLSSSTVNMLWGAANAVVAYVLLVRIGTVDLQATMDVAPVGLGALLIGLFSARHFGRFNGGNTPGAAGTSP